jgi:hypothetical protein
MKFMARCPDDPPCLEKRWRDLCCEDRSQAYCPRCERERRYHRTRTGASYT